MTREDWSRRIQANQRIDNSSRSWCEGLVDEVLMDFESRTCENCKHLSRIPSSGRATRCKVLTLAIEKNFGCNKWECI